MKKILLFFLSLILTVSILGKNVKYERVASINLSSDEMLTALLPENRIVGLSGKINEDKDMSNISDIAKKYPKIEKNLETLLDLNPDLVVGADWIDSNIIQSIKDAGIEVFIYKTPKSYAEQKEVLLSLGKVLDEEDKSQEIVKNMDERLGAVQEKIKALSLKDKPKIMLYTPYETTSDEKTSFNDIVNLIGGINPVVGSGVNSFEKISKEKNPLKILRMEKVVRNAAHSFKNLSKELIENKENMRDDFNQIIMSQDMDQNLENAVNEIVNRGQLIVLDLDSIVNYYLNEIYRESIDEFVERYRNLMKELELRRNEDMKYIQKWEFFAEEIDLKTDIYGVVVEGQINNISSRLSKNLDNIIFTLKADSDKSHGEVKGVINIRRIEGDINIDISTFDFSDLQDLEALHKYVMSGQAGLKKTIILTRDNIYLNGNVYIHKMKLNGNEINKKLRIKNPFLKDMIVPLLSEVKVGNIKYKYSSTTGKLEVQSNLSQEIMKALNSEKGYMRDKITQDMLREGKENLERYRNMITTDNQKALEELENQFDNQSRYLDKIQDTLNKFNIKGEDDFTNKIIDKIFE